jgi:hypothetical protein
MSSFSLSIIGKYYKVKDVKCKTDLMSLFFENLGVLKIYQDLKDSYYEFT